MWLKGDAYVNSGEPSASQSQESTTAEDGEDEDDHTPLVPAASGYTVGERLQRNTNSQQNTGENSTGKGLRVQISSIV